MGRSDFVCEPFCIDLCAIFETQDFDADRGVRVVEAESQEAVFLLAEYDGEVSRRTLPALLDNAVCIYPRVASEYVALGGGYVPKSSSD